MFSLTGLLDLQNSLPTVGLCPCGKEKMKEGKNIENKKFQGVPPWLDFVVVAFFFFGFMFH